MIRNIWAVARNYTDLIKEMGQTTPSEPLIFLKAGSCLVPSGKIIDLPELRSNIFFEVELALQFGADLKIERAAVAVDLTARDIQVLARKQGEPWTLGKSFKNSCPIGDFFDVNPTTELNDLELVLSINGAIKQKGRTSLMVFSSEKLVEYVKKYFPVQPGDLLLTGTPAGVGPLTHGDKIEAQLTGFSKGNWIVSAVNNPI